VNITIAKDMISSQLVVECVTLEQMVDICSKAYRSKPLKEESYLTNCIKAIYKIVAYEDATSYVASNNIGKYTDEGKLIAALLRNKAIIAKAIGLELSTKHKDIATVNQIEFSSSDNSTITYLVR